MLSEKEFRTKLKEMISRAAVQLPRDVVEKLKEAKSRESNPIAEGQLDNILKNLKIAEEKKRPICQDTGIPIFFLKIPSDTRLKFNLKKTIEKTVKEATQSIPLRPNVVDPISRDNSGDNTGLKHPIIHFERSEDRFEIELLLKGGGSENWSRLLMLNPTDTEEKIINEIVKVVKKAKGEFCPPGILGIGIGGTADFANLLAKKSLLKPLDKKNERENLAAFEKKITNRINKLGIGPMGLGGETTILATRIEKAGCHTASLPLAVNPQCWAARRAKARLEDDKIEIEVPE